MPDQLSPDSPDSSEPYGKLDPNIYAVLKDEIGEEGIQALTAYYFHCDHAGILGKSDAAQHSAEWHAKPGKGAKIVLDALIERILTEGKDLEKPELATIKKADLEELKYGGIKLIMAIGDGLSGIWEENNEYRDDKAENYHDALRNLVLKRLFSLHERPPERTRAIGRI